MAVQVENTSAVAAVALEVAQVVVAAFWDTGRHWRKREDRKRHAEVEVAHAETVFRRNTCLSVLIQHSRKMTCCKFVKVVASLSQQPLQLLQRSRMSAAVVLAVVGAAWEMEAVQG